MIYVLGSTGMMGRYLCSYFKQKNIEFTPVCRQGVDASDEVSIQKFSDVIKDSDVLINVVGITNKKLNSHSDEYIYAVNTWFPQVLEGYCLDKGATLYHLSTDCVFRGDIGNYNERFNPDANDIYGMSKRLGEPSNSPVIRTSILGEGEPLEFMGWLLNAKESKITGYVNHHWNGITCLRLCEVLEECITKKLTWKKAKHVFSKPTTKYELALYITGLYNLKKYVVKTQADKPSNKILCTSRKDITFPTFDIFDDLQKQKEFKLNV